MNAITEADLAKALGVQWGCPVFPLEHHNAFLQCAAILPCELMAVRRHAARASFDRQAKFSIWRLSTASTTPCFMRESSQMTGCRVPRHGVAAETAWSRNCARLNA